MALFIGSKGQALANDFKTLPHEGFFFFFSFRILGIFY